VRVATSEGSLVVLGEGECVREGVEGLDGVAGEV